MLRFGCDFQKAQREEIRLPTNAVAKQTQTKKTKAQISGGHQKAHHSGGEPVRGGLKDF